MRTYILSAELSTLNQTVNTTRTELLEHLLRLKGFKFKRILGCYKGSQEVSFMVQDLDHKNAIELAKVFNQESILELNNNKALLLYTTGAKHELGEFTRIPAEEAVLLDAYSVIDGDYFTCVEVVTAA